MDYRAVFAALQLAALLCCARSQLLVDLTLESGRKGKSVVRSTVRKIAESGIFPDDFQTECQSLFLMRMAFAETNNGEDATPGDGGIWAISETTLRVTRSFVSDPNVNEEKGIIIREKILSVFGFDWTTTVYVDDCLNVCDRRKMDVPLYSALAVMIHLKLLNKVIPEDKSFQMTLWKDVFPSYTEENTDRFCDYVQGIYT